MRSDLSGIELEGSNDPVPITVMFADGTRRDLTVSASEAANLKRGGSPASSWHSWSRLRPPTSKLLVWGGALVVASLVIPAIVQQWTDRSKELELKNSLVTEISDSAADLTQSVLLLHQQLLPDDRATREAFRDLDDLRKKAGSNPSPSARTAIAKAEVAARKAQKTEARADQLYINTARTRWSRKAASIQAQLETYFSGEIAAQWHSYTRVLRDFLQLASSVEGEARRELELRVLAFLRRPETVDASEPFPAYRVVADELLEDRHDLVLADVISGNAKGYSTGPRDLWKAITLQ